MNTTFTDRKGRSWDVALDLLKAEQIDSSDFSAVLPEGAKFSILDADKQILSRLITSPSFLMAVIWAIVQDQAEAKHLTYMSALDKIDKDKAVGRYVHDWHPPANSFPISPKEAEAAQKEFISGINGGALRQARQAMMEALGDFFPEQRTALSLLLRQQETAMKKIQEKEKNLEAILEMELDSIIEDNLEEMQSKLRKTREEKHGEISSQSPPTVESPTPTYSDQDSPSGISSSPTILNC